MEHGGTPGTVAGSAPERRGIRASARRIAAHAQALARLEKELARAELERKGATVGAGTGAAIGALVLALFALGFCLATLTAVLALLVDVWLALLIVSVLLVAGAAGCAYAARELIRSGTPLRPEAAIEEARLTRQVLRGTRAD